MKTILKTVALLIVCQTSLWAQKNHIEIELDPLAYIAGRSSGHLAYAFSNHRLQLGYAQLTIPEGMQNGQNLRGLYVAPWMEGSWMAQSGDVTGGRTYSRDSFTFSPTVHVGWSF